jgi:Cu(I)/Ag(I) efflux system membrane fusion protein
MQKFKFVIPILSLLTISSLSAKVIEVNQLFNRTITKVKQENLGSVKSFYGTLQVDESNVIDVVTRYDGFVTQMNANKTMMMVKKDKPLFSIYSDKVLSIYTELKVSKQLNKGLYKSATDKLQALDIHPKEIERLQNSKKVDNIQVLSPSNALVLKKNINEGSFVKKGKLLLQLANIDKLWFIAQVYQKDLPFIQYNMQAQVKVDGINTPFKTKVDYIYPYVNKENKSVNVRFVIENPKTQLYPNMFGVVKLRNSDKTMLTLPKTAVLNKGSKFYVFKPISQKEFEPIEVEVNRISSNKYQILDGLQANEEVINNALFLLDSDALTNALYEEEDEDW